MSHVEQHQFSAEVGRLLDLVVHSLYSDREIFLRELVANAADATDKRRFEALTDAALSLPEKPAIKIAADKEKRLLVISDDGLGMDRQELVQNLGTIARSGTRAFGEKLSQAKPDERPSLIGQFGVGFYSAFMVADHVEVVSRKAGQEEATKWESEGKGAYSLGEAQRDRPGTDIILHIKEDAVEFLDSWRLRSIVRKWADHISWPVMLGEKKEDGTEEDQTINEGTALWRRPKPEISEEEYKEFYNHVSRAFDAPYATLHWHAEGTTEFTALLFIPSQRPFDFMEQTDRQSHVHLHVKRMFITDEAHLLPNWLRFVTGVVDTEDLPLNVSREMLQSTPVLARIRKAVTKRVVSEIRTRAGEGDEKFLSFWNNFGLVIKEGLWEDSEYRQEIAGFARFHSTHGDELITLDEYIGRMKDGQEAIYYLAGDQFEALRGSAQLEGFLARGLEVLLLSDSVDNFWPERLHSYKDKTFRSVVQAHNDLEKFAPDAELAGEAVSVEALLPALKEALGGAVKDVRSTDRLSKSAVVMNVEGGPDLAMQKLLRRSGQALPPTLPILELNPRHPLVHLLAKRVEKGEDIADYGHVLLDLAHVQEGETLPDPNAFARRLTNLLSGQ